MNTPRRTTFALAIAAALWSAAGAHADAVKLSGMWVRDVVVRAIEEGQVVYVVAGGAEVARPFDELEGVRLDQYPELGKAMDALEAGYAKDAVAPLEKLRAEAEEQWVVGYAGALLVRIHDQMRQPVAAVNVYLEMVQRKQDPMFLARPPIDSIRRASADQKHRVSRAIEDTLKRTQGEARQRLTPLIDAAMPDPTPVVGSATPPVALEDERDRPPVALVETDASPAPLREPAVVLPEGMVANELTKLLQRARFREALDQVEPTLHEPGRLDQKLYLTGMAQLGLADQRDDQALYRDAGLNFMRVAIYFPQSSYTGPSLVEAGYVHEQIGSPRVARKLYDKARVLIDPKVDPAYYRRLADLSARLPR